METKKRIKIVLFLFWQFTWGFLQSFAGAVLFLCYRKNRHFLFHGAILTEWNHDLSVSLGAFLFVSDRFYAITPGLTKELEFERLAVHEYGHSIQSLVLGPLYLLVIGLPSAVWANVPYFERKRKEQKKSYYVFLPERSANRLGTKVTGRANPSSPVEDRKA